MLKNARDVRKTRVPFTLTHFDVPLLLSTAALSLLGLAAIFSATRGIDPEEFNRFYLNRQALFLIVGALLLGAVAVVDYRKLRLAAWPIYLISAAVLGLVLTPLGSERNGSQAWFVVGDYQIQPSEMAKVVLIFSLGHFLARCGGVLSLRQFLTALAITAVPVVLIAFQPDLGTALVYAVVSLGMMIVAGAQLRHVAVLAVAGITSLGIVLNSNLIREYQRQRLVSIIDPPRTGIDVFNVEQSQIAIGNGGLTGLGYGQGTQTRSGLVPAQETDFIFTVIGEDLGFVGSAVALAVLGLLIWRTWKTARVAGDLFGCLIATGVFCMILYQSFQAAGMSVGIMPVIGVPMPLLSYGGSSALSVFLAIGLVFNVSLRRDRPLDA